MPRRSQPKSLEASRIALVELVRELESQLAVSDLRSKVLSLVPVFHALRDLGSSLIPSSGSDAARQRILAYLLKYPSTVVHGDELMVVAGIQDWPRRVRELRVQLGWSIASGKTIKKMVEEEEIDRDSEFAGIKPEEYVLLDEEQDRDAAHRWNLANGIRRRQESPKTRILAFLRENVGQPVTGEELRYVAKNKSEWARRTRELRTEEGWPILTRSGGRPDLSIGVYLLEADRQSPIHDRQIPDPVRRDVLRRDGYRCANCDWDHSLWNPSDPRHLELHHIEHHARGGSNSADNLKTLCTVCHDAVHAGEAS